MMEEYNSAKRVDQSIYFEVLNFLTEESAILDAGNYKAWKDFLAEDLKYYMPVRVNHAPGGREQHQQAEFAHFDEDKRSLDIRINRLLLAAENASMIPAESPPPIIRRYITNLRVYTENSMDCYRAHSLFILQRSRLEDQQDTFYGERVDRLRRTDKPLGWEIAERTIQMNFTTVPSNNLNVLF